MAVITATAVMTVLPAMNTEAVADEQSPRPSEGQRALAEAKDSGTRVEVTGERSERTTVFANPDGYSFTLEESSVPVRTRSRNGGWQQPDATLERREDGTVGPKAASVEMNFSAGGATTRSPPSPRAAGPSLWTGPEHCPHPN